MHPCRLLALPSLAGLSIVLADRLVWDAPLGLGAGLLALAVGACLVARLSPRPTAWMAVAAAAALLVIDPGLLAGTLAIMLLGAAALIARGWTPTAPAAAARTICGAVLRALPRLPHDVRLYRRLRVGRMGLSAWIAPVLGALGFLVLFGLGNPLIGHWWGALGDWLGDIGLPAPGRIALWWFALLTAWTLARARGRAMVASSMASVVREPDARWTVRCLIAFNAAFVLQNGCDLVYLWGGAGLPADMTYASYAHRGAYPLVAAALLAGAFVLVCVRPGGLAERSPLARWLVLVFLVQTVVLALSSWWRLDLYVDAYGLSRWRLAALVWMGLVALGLMFIALRIHGRRSSRWLVEANAWALATILLIVAVADSDGLIARHNVARSLHGEQPFDLAYTAGLGIAALPALERFVAIRRDAEARSEVERLRQMLHEELTDWRGWSWRRWAIRAELARSP